MKNTLFRKLARTASAGSGAFPRADGRRRRPVTHFIPTLALTALAVLWAAPCKAQFAIQGEAVAIDVVPGALSNNYVLFPGSNPSLDAGQTAPVQIFIAVSGLPAGTPVTLNLTASAGAPGAGAPIVGYTFSLQIQSGPGIQIPIQIDATNAKPGNYQLVLTATDAATNVGGASLPRGILITTPAANFKSMSASTRLTLSLSGNLVLVKAMAAAENNGVPAHFRVIFHNMGTSTLKVSSGAGSFLLAPGDVLAADFSTQFDVVATVFDGSSGSLEIGFP